LRINPDVDARTHPYISTGLADNKFGIPHGRAREVYRRRHACPTSKWSASTATSARRSWSRGPLDEALERVLELARGLAADGIRLRHVDLGGGFGIRYRDEAPLDVGAYCARVAARSRRPAWKSCSSRGARSWETPACCSRASSISRRTRRSASPSSTPR
jgi:diaminopimelate decarboxylase